MGDYTIYASSSKGQVNFHMTRLTNNSSWDGSPAWSPDGTQITFHSNRDGNSEIYMMNADGSGQINLTNNSVWDSSPAW